MQVSSVNSSPSMQGNLVLRNKAKNVTKEFKLSPEQDKKLADATGALIKDRWPGVILDFENKFKNIKKVIKEVTGDNFLDSMRVKRPVERYTHTFKDGSFYANVNDKFEILHKY